MTKRKQIINSNIVLLCLFTYNPGHNILRLFDVLQKIFVTTSETNSD